MTMPPAIGQVNIIDDKNWTFNDYLHHGDGEHVGADRQVQDEVVVVPVVAVPVVDGAGGPAGLQTKPAWGGCTLSDYWENVANVYYKYRKCPNTEEWWKTVEISRKLWQGWSYDDLFSEKEPNLNSKSTEKFSSKMIV